MDQLKDLVDMNLFESILEFDDEDDPKKEFSTVLIYEYIDTAPRSYHELEEAIKREDLEAVSLLVDWVKRSSPFIFNCNREWHEVKNWTELKAPIEHNNDRPIDKQEALRLIAPVVQERRRHCERLVVALTKFLEERGTPIDQL